MSRRPSASRRNRAPSFEWKFTEIASYAVVALVAVALIYIQCLIGGTRLLFSLPAYGLIALASLLSLLGLRRKLVTPNSLSILSTLLLGGWVILRANHSPVQYLAAPDLYMMVGCLMVYFLTAFYLTALRKRLCLYWVLGGIAGLEIWVGMNQFVKDPTYMLFGLLRPQILQRASGMFISGNHLAGYLEALAILSLSLAFWSRFPLWVKVLCYYLTASCWFGVAISGSRGGYFSTIGGLLAFCAGSAYAIRIANPARFGVALLASFAAVGAVVVIAAFLMFHSELLTRRMQTMIVKDVRIYNWEAALAHIKVSPWFGTGSGTHLIYGRQFRRPQIQADPVHAHCDYLELVAEYGAVGGLCMLFFIVAHLRSGLWGYSQFLRQRLMASGLNTSTAFALELGALCAVVGLLIHSVVDFNMHIPGNALVFSFIFGLLANPGIEHREGFFDRRILPGARLVAPAIGAWTILFALPLLPSEYFAEQARVALRDHNYLECIHLSNIALGQTDAHGTFLGNMLARLGGNPRNPDLYFYRGEANRALGNRMPVFLLKKSYFEAAAASFLEELKIFPQDENALVRLAQSYDGLRQYQESEALYRQALHGDPNLGLLYEDYAKHLQLQGKTREAAAALKTKNDMVLNAVDADQRTTFSDR